MARRLPTSKFQVPLISINQAAADEFFWTMYTKYSSMLEKKTKIVSNLNLQFLDAKFIAVKPQDEQEQSMQLIRRNRASELPSIVRSFMQDTTGIEETDSLVLTALKNSHDNSSRLDNSSLMVLDQEKYLNSDHKRKNSNYIGLIESEIKQKMDQKTIRDTNNRASEGQSSESKEQQEIKKYRAMIKKIKSQNDLIHQEISSLTRARKIMYIGEPTKKVKKIEPICITPNLPSVVLAKQASYNSIYENLSCEYNPYREQSDEIKKKFSNNNLHKHFEAFLAAKNKRIPEFIKNIR